MRNLKQKPRIILILLGSLAIASMMILHWLFAGLPDIAALGSQVPTPSIRIVDRTGRPLYDIIDQEVGRNTVLPLQAIPLALRQATIATEDKSFYDNPGIDALGLMRALWTNTQSGQVVSGGSTITQQVVRNLLLSSDERAQITIRRKLREMLLAWQVTRRYDKDEILALYLNQSYYGGMAYGVEAVAQTYFGKSATDLTLAESALIAGLPQAPALYNPFISPEAAEARQAVVLDLMVRQGYITPAERDLAEREPLQLAATPYPVLAPHFVTMVQAELDKQLTQETLHAAGGVTVRTTLDLNWQQHAERIIREQIELLNNPRNGGPGHAAKNAALVALHPQTGEVLALVGNVDYFDEEHQGAINMALTPRQPGSSLKPIVYAAGMSPSSNIPPVGGERGGVPFTPATRFHDVRTVFITHESDPYVPVNFSRQEHGPVLLRQALASSLNIPAVIALHKVGVAAAMRQATLMGIGTLDDPDEVDLSFALGGGPVRLFDLTAAYAAFANGGSRLTPSLILDVTGAQGNLLYEAEPARLVRVLDERVAWLISDILSDDKARILSFGQDSILNIGRTAAVKTGTTNDFHDNWTVGYTPDVVVGAWVGNADNTPMFGVTGVSGAGPIWHNFMRAVLAGTPDKPFPRPEGLVQAGVCTLSGLLPSQVCPFRRLEWFIEGTEPQAIDTFYHRVEIDKNSGLLADETTPPEQIIPELALALPLELHPWARAEGLLLLDDLLLASTGTSTALSAGAPSLHLVSPDPNTKYRLTTAVPLATQKLPVEVAAPASLQTITLWLDDEPLATLTSPPYRIWWPLAPGVHTMWAAAVDSQERVIQSEPVTFEVLEAIQLSN